MDRYEYKYQLQEDEILEYWRYAVKNMPSTKKQFLWIDLSIPILVVLTLLVFKLYIYLWVDILALAVIFLWLSIGRSFVKLQFLYLRVDNDFLKKMKIDYHKEINVVFADNIYINDKKVNYDQVGEIIPLKKNLLICYKEKELLVLPLRVIGTNQQVANLYKFILLKEKQQNENKRNN